MYADESGNFDFSRKPGATKYFILTTALILDHKIATDLMDLRLDLVWDRVSMKGGYFHATLLATSKSGTLLLRRDQGEMAVL